MNRQGYGIVVGIGLSLQDQRVKSLRLFLEPPCHRSSCRAEPRTGPRHWSCRPLRSSRATPHGPSRSTSCRWERRGRRSQDHRADHPRLRSISIWARDPLTLRADPPENPIISRVISSSRSGYSFSPLRSVRLIVTAVPEVIHVRVGKRAALRFLVQAVRAWTSMSRTCSGSTLSMRLSGRHRPTPRRPPPCVCRGRAEEAGSEPPTPRSRTRICQR